MEIMKVENSHNSNLQDLAISEDGKVLEIVYGGVMDVHWTFYSKDDMFLELSEEKNHQLYQMFSELYDDVINYDSESREEKIPIEDGRVKWYSDDGTIEEVEGVELADSVEIIKEEGKVILNFDYRGRRRGQPGNLAVIRFRSNGSRYDYPYDTFFNQHYSKIKHIDGKEHQIEFKNR